MGLRTRRLAQLIEQRYARSMLWRSVRFTLVTGSIFSSCGLLLFIALLIEFFIVKRTLQDLWLLEFVAISVLGTLLFVIPARLHAKRMRRALRILEAGSGEAVQRNASRAFPQPKEAREE